MAHHEVAAAEGRRSGSGREAVDEFDVAWHGRSAAQRTSARGAQLHAQAKARQTPPHATAGATNERTCRIQARR
jgi:hypothetical protein